MTPVSLYLIFYILLDRQSIERGLFNSQIVEDILKSHGQGRDHSTWIWMLLNLELWYQTYIDKIPRIANS